MLTKLTQLSSFAQLPKFQLMPGIHKAAHYAFRAAGYQWELRRMGDLKLGIWRKTLRRTRQGGTAEGKLPPRDAFPKRLVLVPGFGDTPLSWLPVIGCLMPVLKRRFDEFVVVDFPGFGGFLSKEKCFDSVDLLQEAVADLFDSLRPDTIIGHSLGGYLTTCYAAACGAGKRPTVKKQGYEGPAHVILMDASGAFERDSDMKEFLGRFLLAVEEGFHHLKPHVFAKEPKFFRLVQDEFNRFIRREDIGLFLKSVREEHRVEPVLKDIHSKVWIVWGENDTLIPASFIPAWFSRLRPETGARAVIIKDSGHSPHVEAPFATAALLGQLLLDRMPSAQGLASRWWKLLDQRPCFECDRPAGMPTSSIPAGA